MALREQAGLRDDPFKGRGGPQDGSSHPQYTPGPQLFDPSLFADGGGHSCAAGIEAHPGGGQEGATPLTAGINSVDVCATSGDSVSLPPAMGGQMVVVVNTSVTACVLYAAGSDTMNGLASGTGVQMSRGKVGIFCSAGPGSWWGLMP